MREEVHGNAIKNAKTPNFDKLYSTYPHCLLDASGESVGLPNGQFGNSEVGHSTIGAGYKLTQRLLEVTNYLNTDEIFENNSFKEMINYAKTNDSNIHLIGLASNGGVHNDIKFFERILSKLKKINIKKVYLHLITDGRDTYSKSSLVFIKYINNAIEKHGIGKISTICGRYYAMDRDNKWDRTKLYYDLITYGKGIKTLDIDKTIKDCYEKNITDEFLPPLLLDNSGIIEDRDCIFWLNYRNDRTKQILMPLVNEDFPNFIRKNMKNYVLTFYEVSKTIKTNFLINENLGENPLGVYLSKLGLTQARIAETEKYAHVTFFFDLQKDLNLVGCDKYLIPSPKVATYDLKPEMSAYEVKDKVLECLDKDYDFILVNFANCDMVGHTGNMQATIKAVETVDECLGQILEAAKNNFYKVFLLADHGNADYMLNDKNIKITTHSSSKVPFIITDKKVKLIDGTLCNVAPTILKYMDIALPKEMENTSDLFYNKEESSI